MQIFNATTQQLEDVVWSRDDSNELIATFADGTFLKFPAGLTKDELQTQVDAHDSEANRQEVITPEMEAAKAAEAHAADALVNELNGKTIEDTKAQVGDSTPEGQLNGDDHPEQPAE